MEPNNLKIIGAGLGRTGTMSLRFALKRLGIDPVLHGFEMTKAAGDPANTLQLTDKLSMSDFKKFEVAHNYRKSGDFDSMNEILTKITRGYQASCDEPMRLFCLELLKLNPDALVILTVRDTPEQYADSCLKTQAWTKFAKFEESPLAQSLGKRWFDFLIPSIQSLFEVPEYLINEDRSLDSARRNWLIEDYKKWNLCGKKSIFRKFFSYIYFFF